MKTSYSIQPVCGIVEKRHTINKDVQYESAPIAAPKNASTAAANATTALTNAKTTSDNASTTNAATTAATHVTTDT